MNQAYLKNILSARFDFNIWKDLLDKYKDEDMSLYVDAKIFLR